MLANHVVDVWLWTLAKAQGTPCQPMVIALHCAPGRHCSGVGDRMKGLQTAFWMVCVGCLAPTPTPTPTPPPTLTNGVLKTLSEVLVQSLQIAFWMVCIPQSQTLSLAFPED